MRTVKEATIKSFHYSGFDALEAHARAFVTAYNFAKHLKALRWRASFKTICDAWTRTPDRFKNDPHHLIPGLHSSPPPPLHPKAEVLLRALCFFLRVILSSACDRSRNSERFAVPARCCLALRSPLERGSCRVCKNKLNSFLIYEQINFMLCPWGPQAAVQGQ